MLINQQFEVTISPATAVVVAGLAWLIIMLTIQHLMLINLV